MKGRVTVGREGPPEAGSWSLRMQTQKVAPEVGAEGAGLASGSHP